MEASLYPQAHCPHRTQLLKFTEKTGNGFFNVNCIHYVSSWFHHTIFRVFRRYFTGAFVEPTEESSKFPGSWLVAGLLGVHRENLSESQTDLASDSNNNASLESKKVIFLC